ncbi:hypothetical protein MIV005L [Invertebrate iridescent virus 3]|uniref:Uncharacterized protein 005L n=1 Tax=Invertebrate iridescent virus 3 TaxID=345201 RepID=005L_IIV3|nr:hypothetical protein MIV005L [Invertebrate iridescent virus 3]Q197F5.1 RecName: Full=Uncharacterized protein 005L; Flags: Precursor [Invertebrate iridescent virus 3]ABF82035.1 hypothetical protein MIV005L [Invertebrate iridescent virus 3]
MRYTVLIALQGALLLLLLIDDGQGQSPYPYPGMPCNSSRQCGLGTCVHSRCAHCSSDGTLCSPEDPTMVWPCCPESSCQLVVGLPSLVNHYNCLPNQCTDSSQCPGGFGCMTRRSKCELCKADGEACNSPYLDWRKDKECCSGYCHTEARGLEGVCIDPKKIFCTPKNPWQLAPYPPSYHQPTTLRPPTSLYDSWLMSGFLVKSTTAPSTQEEEDDY